MKLKSTILLLTIFWATCSFSQKISNIRFEQVGKQIHIYYDLEGDKSYTVRVFCSTDNGQNWGAPLKYVTGAVGEDLIPGKGKMIVWDVLKEKEKLTGNIRFKIEATISFFGELGTFSDSRDGQIYKWIRIGDQVWMAENLNFVTTNGSWIYDNKSKYAEIYGRLYNWETAINSCPDGWHLPSNKEWNLLILYLGNEYYAGGEMKEKGTKLWKKPNTDATNFSGFSARPGGHRVNLGEYVFLGETASFWTSLKSNGSSARIFVLEYDHSDIIDDRSIRNYGLSVRCIAY